VSNNALTWDIDQAREDGEAFGRHAGRHAAAAMTQANLTAAETKALGADAVGTVLARADALANAGLSRELVEAWTEAAAEAFNHELDQAARLLSGASGTRH
jgi:hypothetical protein